MLLENRVALITGGASGIGRATAELFAKEGARVVVSDVNIEGGNDAVERIISVGGSAFFVKADIGLMGDVQALTRSNTDRYGRIDVVFSNACHYPMGTATELTEQEWDRTINVCLKARWMLAKCTLPGMVAQGAGVFVITGSVTRCGDSIARILRPRQGGAAGHDTESGARLRAHRSGQRRPARAGAGRGEAAVNINREQMMNDGRIFVGRNHNGDALPGRD